MSFGCRPYTVHNCQMNLTFCLSVCMYVCLSICLSLCLSLSLSYLSRFISIVSFFLSVCLSPREYVVALLRVVVVDDDDDDEDDEDDDVDDGDDGDDDDDDDNDDDDTYAVHIDSVSEGSRVKVRLDESVCECLWNLVESDELLDACLHFLVFLCSLIHPQHNR